MSKELRDMVRWLAFLFWLFSFSTWKTFFVGLFWEAPSLGVADHGVGEEELSGNDCGLRSDEDEVDASSEHRSELSEYLGEVFSNILSNERVYISFDVDKFGYGPLTCEEDAQVKEIMEAISTSIVVKEFRVGTLWPMTWEGVSEALLSNQSVKVLSIQIICSWVIECMSRVLLENTYLEDVQIRAMDNEGAVLVSNVLRHNRTLKRLDVGWCEMNEEGWRVFLDPLSGGNDNNFILEHLDFNIDPRLGSCCDGGQYIANVIGNMICTNTSLLSLAIGYSGVVARRVVSSVGEALHFNKQLSCLDISMYGKPSHGWQGLFASLRPDAQGQQANTSLKQLCIYGGDFQEDVKVGLDSLCDMLRSNTSLIEFQWWNSILTNSVHVVQLLEALKGNKCLQRLDLNDCEGMKGRKVLGAIMDLLDENHYLKEIIIDGTPLGKDGSAEVVKAALEKKAKDRSWEVVQGMATTTPTSGRVFLCGEPYAGKTTLRKTIMENYLPATQKGSMTTRMKALFKRKKGDERLPSGKGIVEERTRGIEVHNFACDDVAMTIWDMAGQEEYHAFHDLVVPNLPMSGSCCSFVLVCNLAYHDDKPHHLKNMEEIITELQYWLKFIVSNTRISNLYLPHVMIVFTHIDEKCSWHPSRLLPRIEELKKKFDGFVEFDDRDFMINAKTYKDSVDGVFNAMENHLRGLLARVPKTIEACDKLQGVIAKRIEDNPHELVVDWESFSKICDEVPELQMKDACDLHLVKRRKEFAALSLHDRGHVIFHEDVEIVIMNPHLFCHDIIGELMNGDKMSRYRPNVQHGITKSDLEMVLASTIAAIEHKVVLEDVLQVMRKMELCYEQEDGTFIIPSILLDGHGKLDWPMKEKVGLIYKYSGRRLTIDNKEKTILSPGFFPRLQVFLRKDFGWACEIMKHMMKFVHNGIEVIIDYNGSPAFDIDIMMRSIGNVKSMNELDSLQRHLINIIVTFCANPTLGCPGVKLVELIMRPSCVEDLVAHKYRSKQVVMVEFLRQMVLLHGDLALKFDWPSEKPVLHMGCDDAKTLLGEQMSNDVLNQRMIDLKTIECQMSLDKGSMDANGNARTMGITKVLKPSLVTNEDLSIKLERLGVTMIQRFDRIDETLDCRFKGLEDTIQEMKLLQENLLPRVCRRLKELMTFTMEFQQHKYPRLAYFKNRESGRFIVKVIPGMQEYVLHLLCEHKDGFHIVEDQEGCELSIGTETSRAFQTVLRRGLKILTLLLKVGAHVGAGMGSMVPDLGKGLLLVLDTPGIGLDEVNVSTTQFLKDVMKPHILRTEEKAAEQWLIDVLKDKCKTSLDIKTKFKLQKVRYVEDYGGGGCVAWICDKHFVEGIHSTTLAMLPSDLAK